MSGKYRRPAPGVYVPLAKLNEITAKVNAEHALSIVDEGDGYVWVCACGSRSASIGKVARHPTRPQAEKRWHEHVQGALRTEIRRASTAA